MIQLLTRKIFLWVFFLIGIGMATPLTAQQNKASQGNIIKKVSSSTQGGTSVLSIRGTFDPGQLENIAIIKKGATSFVVSIPNSLTDPEKIKTPSQKGGLRELFKNINYIESVKEIEEEVVYSVDLEIETRKEYDLQLLKPITSSTIRIKLADLEPVESTELTAEEQLKKNQAEENARELAKKKKLDDKMKSRRTTAKSQKTVNEVLQQYQRPSVMQLSIINASGWQKRAYKLSVFLGREKKKEIEESLGIKLDIVNISNDKNDRHNQSTIYFRNNFLKPALFLARLIPGEQKLVPISSARERLGVDIEIYLGMDFK